MRDIAINKSGIRTASRRKMKANLFLCFIGSAYGKKLPNLNDELPSKVKDCGNLIYSNFPAANLVHIYEVLTNEKLVYVARNGENPDGTTQIRWFLCFKESFDCLPSVPSILGK